MTPKQIVKNFYDLDLAKTEDAIKLFHPDCHLHWNSTQGFTELDHSGIQNMLNGVRESFTSFNYRLSHLLADGDTVTARYTVYVTPIEDTEEIPLAHFISIWEVKDGKLYRGYEISQQVDASDSSISSYAEIKI